MATITPVSVLTGRRAEHRDFFAQLGNTVAICNGHGKNYVYSTVKRTAYVMGLTAPEAAPTGASDGAGVLNGTYKWRVRWKDSNTGTISLPSAEYTASPATNKWEITIPTGTPPARATHWIIERTKDDGSFWFPLNVTASAPHGTAIATTTYEDNTEDDIIAVRITISETQGVLPPYRFCFANGARVFFLGGVVHRPACTLTNAATTCTSADGGFTADMVGWMLSVPSDADGRSYRIAAFVSADSVTLESNYEGTTGTKTTAVAGPQRNRVAWSEAGAIEHGGEAEVGLLSNEMEVGGGEPLISGAGLGDVGTLYAKEHQLWLHTHKFDPKVGIGDGDLQPVATIRGAIGPHCLRYIDGYVYGVDHRGIWRMATGGRATPDEIGAELANDWQTDTLDFEKGDLWHIGHDPQTRTVWFFVSRVGDTYPQKAYIYDLATGKWIGDPVFPWGVPCSIELPDDNGALRLCIYNAAVAGAPSCLWLTGMGNAYGSPTTAVTVNGTATAGAATTLTDALATFYTSGQKLKGVEVLKVAAANGAIESRIIEDNTATVLTVSVAWDTNPVAGDTYHVAPIRARIETGRIPLGTPERKGQYKSLWVWMRNKAAAVGLKVKMFYDGEETADTDFAEALNEDGVTRAAAGEHFTLNSAATDKHRFEIPLGRTDANDVKLELSSDAAGVPWEVLDMALSGDVDNSREPRKD